MECGHWIAVLVWYRIAMVTRELGPVKPDVIHHLVHFEVIRTLDVEGSYLHVKADAFPWYEDFLLDLEKGGQ